MHLVVVIIYCSWCRLCDMLGTRWTLHPHLSKWIRQVRLSASSMSIRVISELCLLGHFCLLHWSEPICPGRFWLSHGWSWVGSATSHAPSQATVLTSCSTPNHSTEARSTGSQLRFCKRKLVAHYNFNSMYRPPYFFKWNMEPLFSFFFFCSAPNDKKSFCSIEGEWNGVMYAKWATGVSSLFPFFFCL